MNIMAVKRKRRPALALPWEGGSGAWRETFSGRRALPLTMLLLSIGLLYGAFQLGSQRDQVRSTRAAITELSRATRAFVVDMGRCPRSPSELVHPPKSGVHYLGQVPRDAWGNELYFRCSEGSPVRIEAVSAGPSGSFFEDDNVK